MEKPIQLLGAIGHEQLADELKRQGIVLAQPDIPDTGTFLVDIGKTNDDCAAIQFRLIEGGIRRFIETARKNNATIPIVLIAPNEQIDARLQKLLDAKKITVVTDNSRRLPEILAETIKTVCKPSEQSEPISQEHSREPVQEQQPEPAFSFSAGEKAELVTLDEAPSTQAVRAARLQVFKPPRMTVIAVFTGNRGAGGSWLCIQIAAFLSKFGDRIRTAVVGGNDSLFLRNKRTDEYTYTIEGFDVYAHTPIAEVIRKGYDFLVLDVGTLVELSSDRTPLSLTAQEYINELIRADLRICVSDCVSWKREGLGYLLNAAAWKEIMANSKIVLSCRTPKSAVNAMERKLGRKFFRAPACLPLELPDETVGFLQDLLQPTVQTGGQRI